ncbi:hypothetical protein Tco_1300762 [Tanacetum coccineum]
MQIPNEFITDDIRATKEFKECMNVFVKKKKIKQIDGETSLPRKSLKLTIKQKKASTTPIPPPGDDQEMDDTAEATLLSLTLHKITLASEAKENIAKVQEKLEEEEIEKMVEGEDDEESYAKPESHKEHPENVDDDDYETNKEKKDDKKDDEKRIMMRRRMSRVELTETVSPSNATTSKAQRKTRHISSKYSHIPGVIHRMCRHQGYMIQCMEKKYVTDSEFWKVHGKVDKVFHEIIPQIAEKATNDVIEGNLKRIMADTIIHERDAL